MMQDIRPFVLQLLLEKGPLPPEEAVDGYAYLDKGHVDSMGFIKFLFRLEERFNVRLTGQEISGDEVRTVAGMVELLARKVAARVPQQNGAAL